MTPENLPVSQRARDAAAVAYESIAGCTVPLSFPKRVRNGEDSELVQTFARFEQLILAEQSPQSVAVGEDVAGLVGEWVEHAGGDCPLTDTNKIIEIKFADGLVTEMRAGAVVWRWGSFISELPGTLPTQCEVVAYRHLSRKPSEQPEAVERVENIDNIPENKAHLDYWFYHPDIGGSRNGCRTSQSRPRRPSRNARTSPGAQP